MTNQTEFKAAGFTLSLADLGLAEAPCAALAYLIQYGLNKSISDAGALAKDAKLPEGKTREEHIADLRKSRFEAIQRGEVGSSSRGPRLRGYDAILAQVTWDTVAAAKKKASAAWVPPKGKGSAEAIREAVADYWSKPRKSQEEVTRKAREQFEAQGTTTIAEEDLDDILG
jgi:hypothetical protein